MCVPAVDKKGADLENLKNLENFKLTNPLHFEDHAATEKRWTRSSRVAIRYDTYSATTAKVRDRFAGPLLGLRGGVRSSSFHQCAD
jgi:hypothetical protein